MTSVGPQTRDQATAALFQRIVKEKALEREILKCPRCSELMEAVPLDIDDNGYQTIWWVCKNTKRMRCDFPIDMPAQVYWVKRSPSQIKDGYIPKPKVDLLPYHHRYLYPSIFAATTRPRSQTGLSPSELDGRSSGTISSAGSVNTREVNFSSGVPSPVTPLTLDWDGSNTRSMDSTDFLLLDSNPNITNPSTPLAIQPPSDGPNIDNNSDICVVVDAREQTPDDRLSEEPSSSISSPRSLAPAPTPKKSSGPSAGTSLKKLILELSSQKSFPKSKLPITEAQAKWMNYDSDGYLKQYKTMLKTVDERLAKRSKRQPNRDSNYDAEPLVTLYSQLVKLEVNKLNTEELETMLQKIDLDMTKVAPNRQRYFQNAYAAHAQLARDAYSTIDNTRLKSKVGAKSYTEKLNMVRNIRNAKDGSDILAAFGADDVARTGVIQRDLDPEQMEKFIQNKIREIVRLIEKKKNKTQVATSSSTVNSTEAAPVQPTVQREAKRKGNNDVTRECEHKTRALVQSKVANFLEAQKQRKRPRNSLSTSSSNAPYPWEESHTDIFMGDTHSDSSYNRHDHLLDESHLHDQLLNQHNAFNMFNYGDDHHDDVIDTSTSPVVDDLAFDAPQMEYTLDLNLPL